jgi:hypothetical protein
MISLMLQEPTSGRRFAIDTEPITRRVLLVVIGLYPLSSTGNGVPSESALNSPLNPDLSAQCQIDGEGVGAIHQPDAGDALE